MGSLVASGLRWARTWWLTVPEPRSFSIGWGFAYAMIGAAGAAVLAAPTDVLPPGHGALAAVVALGLLNVIGMAVAMLSGYREFWKGERLGISLMLCATVIYLFLLFPGDGASPWYVAFTILILGLRWIMIRRFTFKPRG